MWLQIIPPASCSLICVVYKRLLSVMALYYSNTVSLESMAF